jgi:uncharacterized membrane protein
MTRNVSLAIILALSFIGIADSWYLAESAYTNTALTCTLGGALDGCNTVAQSPYAHLFGIPLGTYGLVFYGLAFILAAAALIETKVHARRTLYWLSVIGALASLAFIGVQVFLIKALCVYCLGSAVDAFLIYWLAHITYRRLAVPAAIRPVVEPWTEA